jgi:nucleoside-diphosphate-sugar epimerase
VSNPLATDLEHICQHASADLKSLAGQRLFLTGGTGFFGLWILETIAWANRHLALNLEVVVLTRDPESVRTTAPHLMNDNAITFHIGDITDFSFPDGEFSSIVHGATTTARETFNNENSLKKFNTVARGTEHILEYAAQCQPDNFLYLSSGAAYGTQPQSLTQIPESFSGAPLPASPNAALGIGKRTAEFLCHYYGEQHNLNIKIARCFTSYGPYLPLDIHYAIGNFLADGLKGNEIKILGDGTAQRSYLYVADVVIWLLAILCRGEPQASYNVGSDRVVSIEELANQIAARFDCAVSIAKAPTEGVDVNRYIPCVQRANTELSLEETVSFEVGLERMIEHIGARPDIYGLGDKIL